MTLVNRLPVFSAPLRWRKPHRPGGAFLKSQLNRFTAFGGGICGVLREY